MPSFTIAEDFDVAKQACFGLPQPREFFILRMPLAGKSTLVFVLSFSLPAADHVLIEAKVSCRLRDAQAMLRPPLVTIATASRLTGVVFPLSFPVVQSFFFNCPH